MRINGERCEELFRHVFRKLDFEEAVHGVVCALSLFPETTLRALGIEVHLQTTASHLCLWNTFSVLALEPLTLTKCSET